MINLRRSINETLLTYAPREKWDKLGDYNQLLNGLVLAIAHDMIIEFNLIHEEAARSMGLTKET
jgi:hypothetical protein